MDKSSSDRLKAIDWISWRTAYGPATNVPGQLLQLASDNRQDALAASHDLWCGLCHQHAYVSSAALPALPFILEVLARADEELAAEVLDILWGFAVCTHPQRAVNEEWAAELRRQLSQELPRFQQLSTSPNEEIAFLASSIVEGVS